jgi:nucleoid DNA-binding protein
MTFKSVLNTVAQNKGYGRILLEQCVRSFLAEVAKQVDKENEVRIEGFGTFKLSMIKSHPLAMNPSIIVPAKRVIIFSPDPQLKEFVNQETQTYTLREKR